MSGEPAAHQLIAPDVKLGRNVRIQAFVNLYGCEIGDETRIGPFVEVQKGAKIGERCKISSHTFICEGVTIEPEVFVGHGVTFINDRYPRATNSAGHLKTEADWNCQTTWSNEEHPSDPERRCWEDLRLVKTPSLARGASLLTMCQRTPPSPEIRPNREKRESANESSLS